MHEGINTALTERRMWEQMEALSLASGGQYRGLWQKRTNKLINVEMIESDHESIENENREYERGRTVLALVGKAIDSNTKIPLQWNCRNVPFGDHKTSFSTYIGVVARERVSINYRKWPDVPQAKLDEVYEFIAAISAKFREKSQLKNSSYRGGRRGYQYFEEQVVSFHKANFVVLLLERVLVVLIFTLNKSSEKKIHFTEVPRHLVWIKAHSDVNDDGHIIFNNPTDLKVGEEIRTLMAQSQDGGIGSSGRDDILARALKKPERGGQVVAVGSGITNKEYFGYNKPIPPSHLHTQINNLTSELVAVKNQHNLLASFVLSNLNEEQLRRFPAITTDANGQLDASGQFGSFGQPGLNDTRSIPFIGHVGNQATSFNVQTTGANGQFDASGQFGFFCQPGLTGTRSNPFIGHVGNQANGFDVQTTGANGQIDASVLDEEVSFTQLLTASFGLRQGCKDDRVSRPNHQERLLVEETKPYRVETEPYRVPWPENGPELQHNPHNNFQLQSSRNRSIFLEREIGANHISIFMKYLSDKCHKESVSGMYGFCDVNYLSPLSLLEKGERIDYLARVFGWNEGLNINQTFFAPFHENRHWMLAVISPWNGIVWWLNPSGSENEISQFAEEIINEGIIKFSLEHRKDIKKLKRKPLIKWRKPLVCSLSNLYCGFYVCRYMLEAIANRHQVIPDQYFKDVRRQFGQFSTTYGALGRPFYTPVRPPQPTSIFAEDAGVPCSQRGPFGQFSASTSAVVVPGGGGRGRGRVRRATRGRGRSSVPDPELMSLYAEIDDFDDTDGAQ
ncbi:uncharacterized protein LOC141632771 [Silene latifolia]|uniref:uncharacterized protein LOC141632771 n=1 Tax=Silene latifolia TaxID=37657 RepID=UPI003D771CBE